MGARLWADGASLPESESRRGAGSSDEEKILALWQVLYDDPLWELAALSEIGRSPGERVPGRAAAAVLDRRLGELRLEDSPTLAEAFRRHGLVEQFCAGRDTVLESPEYRGCRQDVRPAELVTPVARAILAVVLGLAAGADAGPLPIDGRARDQLVAALAEELYGSRGIAGSTSRSAAKLAMRLGGTRALRRRRRSLTESSTVLAGDILLYQARGQQIRQHIRACVASARPPVVLLAHSLGGVASVDMLADDPSPEVRLLVTVGSQAPYFYEIDALVSVRYGRKLPPTFPAWLNLYDEQDLLSFMAAPLFHDRVDDVRIDSRQPFPWSHSSYWDNPDVYQLLSQRILADRRFEDDVGR